MLKLPKGLKKKKKGKKSKKDQELFTEEELEQYKREHQKKDQEGLANATTEEASATASTVGSESSNDDEWSKFKALTGGVDSILKQKQEELDRIKATSFFKRVPLPSEEKKKEEEKQREKAIVQAEEEKHRVEEEIKEKEDILKQAVVELSESESEEEEADDIFDTTYIDVIATAEVGLVNVDSSAEEDDGVDPFDTSYADKVIKGPEVSKRGKKLVSIGSAVEVLTGRVENTSAVRSRRPRRGPQDLLLENPEDADSVDLDPSPEPIRNLLDDPADDIPDIPVDLSVSLHIAFQKEQQQKVEEEKQKTDLAEEFGILKQSVDLSEDEFAQLAADSLLKKEESHILQGTSITNPSEDSDWAFFEQPKGAKPPRPVTGPHIPAAVSDEDLSFREDSSDPFDTAFVERILPATLAEDLDFDPRAEDPILETENQTEDYQQLPLPEPEDLFKIDDDEIKIPHNPLVPESAAKEASISDDPFDTSVIDSIVAPKKTELTLIESELLANTPSNLKHSLSDPDFDPRAEEESRPVPTRQESVSHRKSSLVLNIHPAPSRGVKFIVPSEDLLRTDDHSEGHRKPLTPYYSKNPVPLPEKLSDETDPFDTSFVSESKPTDIEINLLERDLLVESKLKHSLSDPDFDPRAKSPEPQSAIKTDLLSASNDFASKVLTPAFESKTFISIDQLEDPFDTSKIESNIQPGKTELHLLADEFVPHVEVEEDLFDTSRDTNHFFAGKVLTPQPTGRAESIEEQDIDPFDTSFANNLAPGPSEIRVLETELIEN